MGSEFKCWSLGTFSLHSLYFFEPSQEPKKVFPVTFLKVLLLLSFLCMKFKKKGWSLMKRMKSFIMFSRLLKPFQLFSNVCQINIAAKGGIPSCRVSSSGIQKKYSQNWCQISARIFCVLHGTKNLQCLLILYTLTWNSNPWYCHTVGTYKS